MIHRTFVDDSKSTMLHHLAPLREYAKRVFLQEESLKPWEETDKARLMQEFVAMAKSFQLTDRDIVILLCR